MRGVNVGLTKVDSANVILTKGDVMNINRNQEIKDAVRQRYASIANKANATNRCENTRTQTGADQLQTCCGPSKFTTNEQSLSCCASDQDTGVDQISKIMGYTDENVNDVPEGANMGLGCGNPTALASLQPGETVVDLGSGGGFDCFLATKAVGDKGKVIGVDMTPDMISKARVNAGKIGAENVEFRLGEIESLPIADNTADVIMSNCVINLSPDKQTVYREAFRVLKPGGRLAISDVLTKAELPENVRNDLALIGACVGGAATIEATRKSLEKAGFEDVRIDLNKHSGELVDEWEPESGNEAKDYVFSAYIQAVKPTLPM